MKRDMEGMTTPPEACNIAVLHDRFPQLGGAEMFAIKAARVLDAPLYTMYVAPTVDIPDDVEVISMAQEKYVHGLSSRLLKWKSGGNNPLETLAVSLDMTTGHPDLAAFDIVLSSAPLSKSYVPDVDQTIIHYPHSPPRWLYDQFQYRSKAFDYPLLSSLVKGYARVWRCFDKEANDYVTQFVANSEIVRDRIRTYYQRDATVLYPPVDDGWFADTDEGYFVTWSRLVPNKRIDLIVEAFQGRDERLVVAGDGPQYDRLCTMTAEDNNIDIRGFVEDIHTLVAHATAVVYAPREEDFGLVGAEALCAGKPLLGVDEGFTAAQVDPGVTGYRFEPTVEALQTTLDRFDPSDFDTETIQQAGTPYTHEAFADGLVEVIEQAVGTQQGRF
jgi:glycosyltransferase involved in cell wall biosynthesis